MRCQDYLRDYFVDLAAKAAFACWGPCNCRSPDKRNAECLPQANTACAKDKGTKTGLQFYEFDHLLGNVCDHFLYKALVGSSAF